MDVFTESTSLVYTSIGYNAMFQDAHWKTDYKDCEVLCATFIREARLSQAILGKPHPKINMYCG